MMLRTAGELFARPDCTHIVALNNPNQNVHLEHCPAGFRLIFGSHGPDQRFREFAGLDDVSTYLAQTFARIGNLVHEAVWQDISAFPPFPYDVLYRPVQTPMELSVLPNSEQAQAHGPHVVYGAASITTPDDFHYFVTPQSDWLVVEHPAHTFSGYGGRAVLRPTHNLLDRVRLRMENARLRRERRLHTAVRPGSTVVYGKPPPDWRDYRQLIPAETAQ